MNESLASAPPLHLAIVGTFKFPDGSAATQRIQTLVKLFQDAGVDQVQIGSADPTPDALPKKICDQPNPVFHLSEYADPKQPRILQALRHFHWGGRAARWLKVFCDNETAVLLYGGYSAFAWHLLRSLRPIQTPLIIDAVEWYQPTHVPGGPLGPYRWNTELAMRWLFPKARNIIAISRFLQRHFEAKGCHVVHIPAILDALAVSPNLTPRSEAIPLKLGYTGTPGKKDLLEPMIEAILSLDPGGTKIRFTLAGPSLDYLLALPALKRRGLTQLPPSLVTLGYVSHEEANALIRESDFSVLLRSPQLYAMAGFPTKVPESLAVGTPLICNLTSDLGDYIVDGLQALVCEEPTVESCLQALNRALAMNYHEKLAMRIASRALAERSFDYRNYISDLKIFLASLRSAS
jgi:glycosyltransferase involved in cell wall biosynthesis